MGALSGDKPFRKYLYDPENPPFNYFGDLQDPCGKLTLSNNRLTDVVPPQSLVVYTTCYDDDPPADIKGLNVERKKDEGGRERAFLNWEASTEKDFCYYRIYRSELPDVEISPRKEVGTTVVNSFKDMSVHSMPKYYYKVIAVDQSGNASKQQLSNLADSNLAGSNLAGSNLAGSWQQYKYQKVLSMSYVTLQN